MAAIEEVIVQLAEQIAQRALTAGVRVAVAESLTSGLLSAALGAAPDAGEWFAGGVVAYTVESKALVLGVRDGIDPCSAECAREMAAGVRSALEVDVAVATTGVGGPDPQDGHEAGTVYVGWANADDQGAELFSFVGGPEEVLTQTIEQAQRILLLRGLSGEG